MSADETPGGVGSLLGLAVAVVAVSTSAVLTRYAFAGGAEPLAVAFWRTLGGALALAPVAATTRPVELARQRRRVLAAGVFLGLHFALWLTSLDYTTVASSVTLVTMSPVFVALGARRWLAESATTRTWIGMALAMAGAVTIGLADGVDVVLGPRALAGDAMALAGAVAVAGYLLLGRQVRQQVATSWYSSRTYGWAALLLGVACVATGTPLWGFSGQAWWAIAGIVAGPQLLGHTILNSLLGRVSPTTISISVLAEPVGATALAWLFLDELPATLFWVGAPLVLAGIAIATTMARSRTRDQEAFLVTHQHHGHHDDDRQRWDERYSSEDRVWSGEPNAALVAEVADMPPGRALDIGCGEGGDAIWLARSGWEVTAIDVSPIAIQRARAAAEAAGVDVTWVADDVTSSSTELGTFDLVSCQYLPLRKGDGHNLQRVLDAVAPGGTLLFVHHADQVDIAHEHGYDPDEFVQPRDVVDALDDDWEIVVHETRPRHGPPHRGRDSDDVVVRARRR